jgi:protein-tyrosine phosphatase
MQSNPENTYPIKWITPQIAIGYAPHAQADIDFIKSREIDAILNLCAECYDLHEIERAAGFEVLWLPIADENAPELDMAQMALAWMDSILAQGKKVLVHCRFGIGRTGTLVVAWLLKQGYTRDDALEMLSHTPAEPKSRQQWDFLNAYSIAVGIPAIQRPAALEKSSTRLGKFFRKHFLMQLWGAD